MHQKTSQKSTTIFLSCNSHLKFQSLQFNQTILYQMRITTKINDGKLIMKIKLLKMIN
jgi:hypothetical protein